MAVAGKPIFNDVDGTWKLFIRKPIYGTCVAISKRIVERARSAGVLVDVRCPGGRSVLSPDEIVKLGKVVKKVFRYPEHPMVMYQINLESDAEEKEED